MSRKPKPIEPRFDKSTLPKDGQNVKWQVGEVENWMIGCYNADEEMFYINESNWSYAFDIIHWIPIDDN